MTRCLLILAALAATAESHAVGYFNMPTSAQQWFGMGYGPGYHAPMVLGGACRAPIAAQPVIRRRSLPKLPTFATPTPLAPTCVDCQPLPAAPPHDAWRPAAPATPVIEPVPVAPVIVPPGTTLPTPAMGQLMGPLMGRLMGPMPITGYDLEPSGPPPHRSACQPQPARR